MLWIHYRIPYWDFKIIFGWKKVLKTKKLTKQDGLEWVDFEVDMSDYKDGKYPHEHITVRIFNDMEKIFHQKNIKIEKWWYIPCFNSPVYSISGWWPEFLEEYYERTKPDWDEHLYKAKKKEKEKRKKAEEQEGKIKTHIQSMNANQLRSMERKYCSECDRNGKECILGIVTVCNRIICEDCYEADEDINGYKWESYY